MKHSTMLGLTLAAVIFTFFVSFESVDIARLEHQSSLNSKNPCAEPAIRNDIVNGASALYRAPYRSLNQTVTNTEYSNKQSLSCHGVFMSRAGVATSASFTVSPSRTDNEVDSFSPD